MDIFASADFEFIKIEHKATFIDLATPAEFVILWSNYRKIWGLQTVTTKNQFFQIYCRTKEVCPQPARPKKS